jgi:hypothetical protein
MSRGYAENINRSPPIQQERRSQVGAYYLPIPFLSSHTLVRRTDKAHQSTLSPALISMPIYLSAVSSLLGADRFGTCQFTATYCRRVGEMDYVCSALVSILCVLFR